MKLKNIFTVLIFVLIISAKAQLSYFNKAQIAFDNKNYKGADKLLQQCIEHEETKNSPKVWLLLAKNQFEISKIPSLEKKYPSAFKQTMKYAEKVLEKCQTKEQKQAIIEENTEFFDAIVGQNNKEAIDAYNHNKFGKAVPIFKRSLVFASDTQSIVYLANSLYELGQISESMVYYKQAANLIFNKIAANTNELGKTNAKLFGFYRDPFRKLGKYYINSKQYDTAQLFVKQGLDVLPNDDTLLYYHYGLLRYALGKTSPGYDYLNLVNQGLQKYPADSFFNHKNNAIYIFLLNGLARANDTLQFDSLWQKMANQKEGLRNSKEIQVIKSFDIFAGLTKKEFSEKFYTYLAEIQLQEATFFAFRKYLIENEISVAANQHPVIAVMPNAQAALLLFNQYIAMESKNKSHSKAREEYTLLKNKSVFGYYDFLPLLKLNDKCAADNAQKPEFKIKAKELRYRLVKEAIDSGDFRLSNSVLNECNTRYPTETSKNEELQKYLVVNDFKVNYFGTRVNTINSRVKENGVPIYEWNGGVEKNCSEGKMNEIIVQRATRRINYFRRMAQVDDNVVLTKDNNENCQLAALMCEANKSMSHDPSDAWRCFVPDGLNALRLSILSKDNNPLIAITGAMGHNHPTVGNRRWLLYPYAQYMGIGTAQNYTAILAVDKSNRTDTLIYKTKPVTWPPKGYCPKMLVFKKWSFSLDQNLQGATVQMKTASGENIELTTEAIVDGYGLNTIVWEPKLSANNLADSTELKVLITLKNKKTYSYTVKIIDIKV